MRVASPICLVLLFSIPAFAQIGKPSADAPNVTFIREPNTYGTTSETSHTIQSFEFLPRDPNMTITMLTYARRYVSSPSGCCADAPFLLPAGAAIVAHEVEGCDNSPIGRITGIIGTCPIPGDFCGVIEPFVVTGIAETPGCQLFRAEISPPVTVDNATTSYFYEFVNENDVSGDITVAAVRIYYKLQVSPAPATATFADVPVGHPQHRFVEALVAAGITAGCGGGNFCPTTPVTRGQMAVFLSAALGLHWAP